MQLEELQQQWQRLDEKLERSWKAESELLRLAVSRPARRLVHRMAFWPALDVAVCIGILLLTGFFLANHWGNWPLVAPASIVMIAAILLLIGSIRQLVCISEIDWGATVVEIQSSLSRLRILKIRQFKWIILSSPLVGFCGLVVGLQWLLDRLPEQHFILDKLNPWWILGNYAFGVLFILFGQIVIRFLAKRLQNRGWWRQVLDGVSGTSMTKAREELDRWARLDDEVSDDTD